MSRDIYTGLAGAAATWTQLEVLSGNVANTSTAGYRSGKVAFQLAGSNEGVLGKSYAEPTRVYADRSDGPVHHDGDPLHVALQGDGFLALGGGQGATLLSRDGRMHLDPEGRLTHGSGLLVLGERGPIDVPAGETIRIAEDGTVFGSESGELDRLLLLTGTVEPVGGNLWESTGVTSPASVRVVQGAVEGSNVDPVASMVELVEASRYFEAFQKAMQTSDELDTRLNQVGRR